jgi:hypothetical protein
MTRILVLGIGCVTAKYLPAALRGAGHEPVFLLDLDAYAGEPRDTLAACEWYPADLDDPEAVLRLLRDKPEILDGVGAVSGFFDELYPLVERVAQAHGLAYVGQVAARLADKAEVVGLIPEYSPRSIAFHPDGVPVARLRELGPELVLKPAVGTGGLGAVRLDTAALSAGTVRAAIAASGLRGAGEQCWVAQERLDGQLISLEGYVTDGVLRVIGFSLRGRIGWTEVDNLYPADSEIPATIRDHCTAAVRKLVRRAGYREGYLHCEFLADLAQGSGSQPRLIDANLGRLGGATVVEQVALAHGLGAGEVARHVLLLPLGLASRVPAYRPVELATPTLSYYYGLRDGGRVRSIQLPPDLDCVHTRFARADGAAPPIGTSDYAWVGLLTGTTAAARRDIDRIRIETDSGFAAPCYAP